MEKRAAKGKKTPAIENRPILFEDLRNIWDGFIQLHSSRHTGFGPTALPASEIKAWLDIKGIRKQEIRLEYFELLHAMDCKWLSWARDKQKKESNDGKSKTGNRRKKS